MFNTNLHYDFYMPRVNNRKVEPIIHQFQTTIESTNTHTHTHTAYQSSHIHPNASIHWEK